MDDDFNKKKRKRSTYQRLKINAKKGNLSKGKQLSEEEHSYYLGLMGQMRNVEEEEKQMIFRSFFREFNKDERQRELACNQLVSRMLDEVLPQSTILEYLTISDEFSKDLRIMFTDPFASHGLQSLLIEGLNKYQKVETNLKSEEQNIERLSEEDGVKIVEFLVKVSKFALNNFEDFIFDKYASHVIRTVLEITTGKASKETKGEENVNKHGLNKNTKYRVPNELKEVISLVIDRFISRSTNISDIACKNCSSAVIQNLIDVAKDFDQSDKLCRVVIKGLLEIKLDNIGDTVLHSVFHSSPAMMLLQAAITQGSPDLQLEIYNSFFKDKLKNIISVASSFFPLQTLLKDWKNQDNFDELFEAMDESMLELAFNERRFGIIFALAEGCTTLQSNQNKCVKKIMKILQCKEKENQILVVPLLIYMITRDHFIECRGVLPKTEKLGAFIVQELLKYKNNSKIIDSLLAMNSSQLEIICCDPKASHVVTSFVKAENVNEKSKMVLAERLKGKMTTLALSKFGSYCLEALFEVLSVKSKTWICQELSKDEIRIKEDKIGVIIYNKLKVGMFSKRKDKSDWETLVARQDKKRKLVQEIFEAAGCGSKKTKSEETDGDYQIEKDTENDPNVGENIEIFSKKMKKSKRKESTTNFKSEEHTELDPDVAEFTKVKKKKSKNKKDKI